MENKFNEKEEQEIRGLLDELGSKHGVDREKARLALVSKGKDMIDYLMEYISHPKHTYRWEAVKTLEGINDPAAIPLFVQALEDDESDIRWIAAEGLIRLGEQSIEPLLKAIIETENSSFVLSGAHHVIYDLKKKHKIPGDFPVDDFLYAVKYPELKGGIKAFAYDLLNKLETK